MDCSVQCRGQSKIVNIETLLLAYLFMVLCRFQHCAGHITVGSLVGRGNQHMQLIKVLYCKLLTIPKQIPTFPL